VSSSVSTKRALPRLEVQPLSGSAEDYDGLLDLIGDVDIVLIGEASHGTHEFYRERAQVRPAFPESYEALFHETGTSRFLVDLLNGPTAEILRHPRLERAIGVIGKPPETYPTAL
jgi:erythromycin esterase-like protein